MRQGIESLFKVKDSFMPLDDDVNETEIRERQMAYGILLRSIDAMKMTEDAIESRVGDIKRKLDKSLQVRTRQICILVIHLLCLKCTSLQALTL